MFLMTYLKFASNILSLDMGSFDEIHIVIVLGGKRLLWKPMGNDLVYSSLFIKMDVLGMNCEKRMIGSVIRALMRGRIVWRGHVLASILCLQCMKWMKKGKRVENITG